jgi:hypothetical protein
MKTYSAEEIEINKNNQEWINQEINTTNGFILYKMKDYKIYPDKEVLMQNKHPLAIQFLLDNYDLNNQEKEDIMDWLSSQGIDEKLFKEELDENTIDNFLSKKKEIPQDTILPLNLILKHASYLLEEDSYRIDNILNLSFQKISYQDFVKIPKKIKEKYPWIYTYNKNFFKNREHGIEYYQIVKNKKEGLNLKYYKNFPFEEKDLPMIDNILKKTNDREYDKKKYNDLMNYGLDKFISKLDYFKKYNQSDLTSFSLKEIQEHRKEIQEIIIHKNKKEDWRQGFYALYDMKININQLEILMNDSFFEQLKNKTREHRLFEHIDKDFPKERKEKEIFIRNYYIQYMLPKLSEVSSEEINNMLRVMDQIYYQLNYNQEEEKKEIIQKIEKLTSFILEKEINTNQLPFFINLKKEIFAIDNQELIDKKFHKFVNPNGFFWLISLWKEVGSNPNNLEKKSQINIESMLMKLVESINDKQFFKDKKINNNYKKIFLTIIEYFENQELKYVRHSFKNELMTLKNLIKGKKLLKLSNIDWNQDNYNFIAFDSENLEKNHYQETIQMIRPEFAEEYLQQKKHFSKSLFSFLINNAHQKENQVLLKKYIEIFQEDIENSPLLPKILQSPYQKYFYQNTSFEKEEKIFQEIKELTLLMDELYQKEKILEQKIEVNYNKIKGKLDYLQIQQEQDWNQISIDDLNEENQLKALFYFTNKKEEIKKQIEENKQKISFSFIEYYIEEQLKNHNFEEINWMDENSWLYKLKDNIKNHLHEMSYEDFMNNIENKYFLKTMFNLKEDYNQQQILQLKQFSNEQCKNITDKILQMLLNHQNEILRYSEGNIGDSLKKIFFLFDHQKVDFVKEYMKDKYPEYLLYSYDYQVEKSFKTSNFIKTPYSPEELLKIYEDIYQKYQTYIIHTTTNDRIYNFIHNMLVPDNQRRENKEEKIKTMQEYQKKIEFFKEKNPAIYLLSIYPENIHSFNPYWGDDDGKGNKITRDESENIFFSKYIDIPKMLEGMLLFLKTFDSKYIQNKDKEEIKGLIQRFYYSLEFEENNNNVYLSHLNENQSTIICDFFMNHYPLILFRNNRLGSIKNLQKYIQENKKEYYSLNHIREILYPKEDMIPNYFSMNDSSGNLSSVGLNILQYFQNAIEYAVEKNNTEIIEYLSFEIESYKFVEKNFDYEKKQKYYQNKEHITTSIIDFIKENNVFQQYLEKAKLKIFLDKNLVEQKVKNKFNKI